MTAAAPARITLTGVRKRFVTPRAAVDALGPLTLDVAEGEFVVLVGPSGCGKTTLLNLVAGFEAPTEGEVRVDGAPVDGPGPDRAMIFQEPALFPWLNIEDNVAFGLRQHAGMSAPERRAVAREYIRLVHLQGFERAFVHELSGGMKQRAALARALAPRPRALLCDEPFGSLDALTRERLYAELQELHAQTRRTTLFVTHNTREAACLADRVVVLTERPAAVACVLTVELPRPRNFYDPRVSELAGEILAKLRTEPAAAPGGRDA
ncbi:MAG TPA: ABC transporter ATP-binding protein [Thermoanaerobaculaceae bacterium]|nr:ABC transporter ATP-binding protein [Thermoanaerobaculaceae bacterium]